MKVRDIQPQPTWGGHVSTASYALGFVLSLIFTMLAFFIVRQKLLTGYSLGTALFILAILQTWTQLIFYFNFGKETKPKWNYWAFYLMLVLMMIVVIGSLLIMANLDYRMMMHD